MTNKMTTIVALAKKLYTEGAGGGRPAWDQLQTGGATQQVWIERATKESKLAALQTAARKHIGF